MLILPITASVRMAIIFHLVPLLVLVKIILNFRKIKNELTFEKAKFILTVWEKKFLWYFFVISVSSKMLKVHGI